MTGGIIVPGKVILICGKIGSGKSHYAAKLKNKMNALILSCDELAHTLFPSGLGGQHERNQSIQAGTSQGYYVDEGLMKKLLSVFEEPGKDEITVWHSNRRKDDPQHP